MPVLRTWKHVEITASEPFPTEAQAIGKALARLLNEWSVPPGGFIAIPSETRMGDNRYTLQALIFTDHEPEGQEILSV